MLSRRDVLSRSCAVRVMYCPERVAEGVCCPGRCVVKGGVSDHGGCFPEGVCCPVGGVLSGAGVLSIT